MRTFDLYSPVVFELKPKLPHFQIDSVHWDNKVVRHCPINNFPCLQHFFAALYQQHNGSVRQNSRAILWMMPSKKYAAEKKRGKMAPDDTKKWQQKNATEKMPPKNGTRWHKKGTADGIEKCHRMAPFWNCTKKRKESRPSHQTLNWQMRVNDARTGASTKGSFL